MEFLDYIGLAKFKELLDSENGDKFATKQEITAKGNTSVINPDNTQEKFNDNQVYFMFDEDSGNQDRKIDLYVNKDNDFNESHVGVKAYHFMDGLSCPTDGLKGDYASIVAKNFVIRDDDKVATIGIDDIDVTLDLNNFYEKDEVDELLDDKADASSVYTKAEVDALIAQLQELINPTTPEPEEP